MVSCKYKNGEAVTEKAHHVTSNSGCAHRYSSHKNYDMVYGEMIEYLNKPTDTGRRIWYFWARYDLGGGTTKIAELNVHYIKAAPVVSQSVPFPIPTPPTITDIPLAAEAVAITAPWISIVHLYIVAVALPVYEPEIPEPITAENSVTTTVYVILPIPPLPLPDNTIITPINP